METKLELDQLILKITIEKLHTVDLFAFLLTGFLLSYFKKSLSGLESHTGRVHLSSCRIKQYLYLLSPLEDGSPLQHYPQRKICYTQYSTH